MYVGFLEVEFEPRNKKKKIKLKRLILKKNRLKTEKCWEEQIPEQFAPIVKKFSMLFYSYCALCNATIQISLESTYVTLRE